MGFQFCSFELCFHADFLLFAENVIFLRILLRVFHFRHFKVILKESYSILISILLLDEMTDFGVKFILDLLVFNEQDANVRIVTEANT